MAKIDQHIQKPRNIKTDQGSTKMDNENDTSFGTDLRINEGFLEKNHNTHITWNILHVFTNRHFCINFYFVVRLKQF